MLLPMFKRELVLRPNCLITRRPLCLLTGPRSLFYYRSPWQALHHYLFQHGYKVEIMKLPFQSYPQRENYLKLMLGKLTQSHIMCDATTYRELGSILSQAEQSTMTVFTDTKLDNLPKGTFQLKMNYPVFSLAYGLHKFYVKLRNIETPSASEVGLNIPAQLYDQILDHCVKLAEMDFYDLDLNYEP